MLLTGVTTTSAGQQLSDEEFSELLSLDIVDLTSLVISVASKREERISEAPSVISVVTAEEIAAFGGKNLKDVLGRITSMQGFRSHFFSHVTSVRGQNLKHSINEILFLVNGRPFRTSWNGGTHYLLLMSFPLDMVKSLEVIRGPGSVLYGSSAFSGVINIITKTSEDVAGPQLSSSYGSFNTRSIAAAAGAQTSAVNSVVAAKASRSDGWTFDAVDERAVDDSVDMAEANTGAVAVVNSGGFMVTTVYTESPELLPETIATWDAQLFYQRSNFYGALTYFHSDIKNLISRVPEEGNVFVFSNKGEARFKGVELEARYNANRHLTLLGSATYQQSDDNSDVDDVSFSSNVMLKFGRSYSTDQGHTYSIFNSYFGDPAEISQHNPDVATVNPEAEAYHLMTLNVGLDIDHLLRRSSGPQMRLELYIDNALDEDILYPEFNQKNINSIPVHSGRAYYATFNVAF